MAPETDAEASAPWVPDGLTKSNSNASTGGRSTKSTGGRSTKSTGGRSAKSYESIRCIGRYPLGSLRLVSHDDPLPPLPVQRGLSMVPWNRLTHNMGRGDVVIVLYLPEDYAVNYDGVSYAVKKFAGVKQVPAGAHFFWVANPDDGVSSSRCGFWIMSTGINRVHVVEWHKYNEVFVLPTRTEARIQAENVDEIYAKLPSYRDPSAVGTRTGVFDADKAIENAGIWKQLTGSITDTALNRIAAEQEGGWNMHTSDRVAGSLRLPFAMTIGETFAHPVFQCHDLKFCFEQKSRVFHSAHAGSERWLDARDSSSYILSRVKDDDDDDSDNNSRKTLYEKDMVGEFQFLYIVGMYLENEACIRQWWFTVLRLLLKAYRLAIRRPRLMVAFLCSITAQVTHSTHGLETSIFEDNAANSRDLRLALTIYKRRLRELLKEQDKEAITPDHLAVEAEFSRLETAVSSVLGWDLKANYLRRGKVTTEDGERLQLELGELEEEDGYGGWSRPAVQPDDQGRRGLGLISWRD